MCKNTPEIPANMQRNLVEMLKQCIIPFWSFSHNFLKLLCICTLNRFKSLPTRCAPHLRQASFMLWKIDSKWSVAWLCRCQDGPECGCIVLIQLFARKYLLRPGTFQSIFVLVIAVSSLINKRSVQLCIEALTRRCWFNHTYLDYSMNAFFVAERNAFQFKYLNRRYFSVYKFARNG